MRDSICLLALLSSSIVAAADHPNWTELAKLHRLPKDSEVVTKFVKEHDLKEVTKGPSGSFTPDDYAYSLLYRRNQVKTIILKVAPPQGGYAQDNWRSFSRGLPYKLTASDGRADVVRKLGQPTKPEGDRWHHDGLEIWVFFDGDESGIIELYIEPLKEDTKS